MGASFKGAGRVEKTSMLKRHPEIRNRNRLQTELPLETDSQREEVMLLEPGNLGTLWEVEPHVDGGEAA